MEEDSPYQLDITWACKRPITYEGGELAASDVLADLEDEPVGEDEPPESGRSTTKSSTQTHLRRLLEQAVCAALRRHSITHAHISLALVDDAGIAELNESHLHHTGPTDVITYDMRDSENEAGIEGEIVISVETASREGDARGHGPFAELALYAVHGTLHLIGYDDVEADKALRMHAMEDEILVSIGLGAVYEGRKL